MQLDMTKGRPLPVILQFTLPLIIGNIFQQLYNMVDTIIVGRYVGADALAAVGSTGTIMFLLTGFSQGITAGFAILISQLRRFAVSDFQLFPSFHPSKECALVKRYLDSHYSDDINLEQLASLSHLNKYYLSHEFTRYYGISPISYLTHRRIEVCKNLLENTDHEISDIAHLAGFSSQSYLAQSFRKYCGMTAGEYRRSKKNQTI